MSECFLTMKTTNRPRDECFEDAILRALKTHNLKQIAPAK